MNAMAGGSPAVAESVWIRVAKTEIYIQLKSNWTLNAYVTAHILLHIQSFSVQHIRNYIWPHSWQIKWKHNESPKQPNANVLENNESTPKKNIHVNQNAVLC